LLLIFWKENYLVEEEKTICLKRELLGNKNITESFECYLIESPQWNDQENYFA
jgi:hypothetical protein